MTKMRTFIVVSSLLLIVLKSFILPAWSYSVPSNSFGATTPAKGMMSSAMISRRRKRSTRSYPPSATGLTRRPNYITPLVPSSSSSSTTYVMPQTSARQSQTELNAGLFGDIGTFVGLGISLYFFCQTKSSDRKSWEESRARRREELMREGSWVPPERTANSRANDSRTSSFATGTDSPRRSFQSQSYVPKISRPSPPKIPPPFPPSSTIARPLEVVLSTSNKSNKINRYSDLFSKLNPSEQLRGDSFNLLNIFNSKPRTGRDRRGPNNNPDEELFFVNPQSTGDQPPRRTVESNGFTTPSFSTIPGPVKRSTTYGEKENDFTRKSSPTYSGLNNPADTSRSGSNVNNNFPASTARFGGVSGYMNSLSGSNGAIQSNNLQYNAPEPTISDSRMGSAFGGSYLDNLASSASSAQAFPATTSDFRSSDEFGAAAPVPPRASYLDSLASMQTLPSPIPQEERRYRISDDSTKSYAEELDELEKIIKETSLALNSDNEYSSGSPGAGGGVQELYSAPIRNRQNLDETSGTNWQQYTNPAQAYETENTRNYGSNWGMASPNMNNGLRESSETFNSSPNWNRGRTSGFQDETTDTIDNMSSRFERNLNEYQSDSNEDIKTFSNGSFGGYRVPGTASYLDSL